jgi:hypothetical protein
LEQLRPWAAGFELRKHAMQSMKLSDTALSETLVRLGWKAKLITLFTYADCAQFTRNSKGSRSIPCLEQIVSELESERDKSQSLAKAWSVGDIDALRDDALRQEPDMCVQGMFDDAGQARDATERHAEYWLAAVDVALKTNNSTFASVPADKIFAPDGWLSALRARGYDVQEPR